MKVDISVVVTLHAESRIVHRTFRALQAAIEYAGRNRLVTEVVIVLDKVSDKTLEQTLQRWQSSYSGLLSICRCDFGALSLARNLGVSNAKGKYISILDGDDLYGEQWLYKAYLVCSADPTLIAHPEAYYSFPHETNLRFSNKDALTHLDLINENKWTALTMATRDTFVNIPYVKDDNHFAYQDWLWNCETAANGYRHVLVPKTLMAIRQKRVGKSLWQKSHALKKVVRPNALFRNIFLLEYARCFGRDNMCQSKNMIFHFISECFRRLANKILDYLYIYRPFLLQQLIGLKRIIASRIYKICRTSGYPQWIVEQLSQMARVEPVLENFYKSQVRYVNNSYRLFRAINANMSTLVKDKVARIYIINSLEPDCVVLNALFHLTMAQGSLYIITTERSPNILKRHVPDNIVHIDIGNLNLNFEEKVKLLHRLLLESNIDYIHLFGSLLAFEILERYPGTFDSIKIYASFCEAELSRTDGILSRKICYSDDVLDCFSKISTDSTLLKKYFIQTYGLTDNKVYLHKLPFAPHIVAGLIKSGEICDLNFSGDVKASVPIRILVMGKRIPFRSKKAFRDAARESGKKKSPVHIKFCEYDRFISNRPHSTSTGLLHTIKNIRRRMLGCSHDRNIIAIQDYMPEMLMPVVQFFGSGIPALIFGNEFPRELFNDQTGWIFNGSDKNGEFRNHLQQIVADPTCIAEKGESARKFVGRNYSHSDFKNRVDTFYR